MRLALALLGSTFLGCTFVPRVQCPEQGGPSWTEYRSSHFTIMSDSPETKAEALLQQLERLRAADLDALVGEQVEIPGRLRVVAFARMMDFEEFAGGVGGYYERDGYGRPAMVVAVPAMWKFPEALSHELAHYVSFYLFPVQPMWFSEGLAGFVQTIPLRGENVAGTLPEHFARFLSYDGNLHARDILAWKGVENSWTPGRYHVWSWLLYHWLWNNRSADFATYQKHLMDGDDPDSAWAAAFPGYDPAQDNAMARLDSELYRYRTDLTLRGYRVKTVIPQVRYTKQPISPSEVHVLLLAHRRAWSQDRNISRRFMRAQLEEALREDPHNAGAMIALARLDGKISAEKARGIATASPGDWRAWTTLGGVADASAAEREAANRKAIDLNPEDWVALKNLAWILALTGRAKEALLFANRALDLAPWSATAVDTLAEIAAQLGRCPEARRLIQRAAKVEQFNSGRNEAGRDRQTDVDSRCPIATTTSDPRAGRD